jgi:hypothetical protein
MKYYFTSSVSVYQDLGIFMDVCSFEQTDVFVCGLVLMGGACLCCPHGVIQLEVSYDLPLMPLNEAGRIDSRDAHPFLWAQEYTQTWCPGIPKAHTVLGLRRLSIYRPGN